MILKRNWLGASAIVGSLGVVILTTLLPKPVLSQNVFIYGGGGGGASGHDSNGDVVLGGTGSGAYIGTQQLTSFATGENGSGNFWGKGGDGALSGQAPYMEGSWCTTSGDYIDCQANPGAIGRGGSGDGGAGGGADFFVEKDTIFDRIWLQAGDGGYPSQASLAQDGFIGGAGGYVNFKAKGWTVSLKNELYIESGNESDGSQYTGNISEGGAAIFTAGQLLLANDDPNSPVTINLIKHEGDLTFYVDEFNALNGDANIQLLDTEAWNPSYTKNVNFGNMMIGLGRTININGNGDYYLNGLTIGDVSQTNFTKSATFSSEPAINYFGTLGLTFYIPENIAAGDVLLDIQNTSLTLNKTDVHLALAGNTLKTLQYGDKIYLISGNVTGTLSSVANGFKDNTTALSTTTRSRQTRAVVDYGAKEWTFNVAVEDGQGLTAELQNPDDTDDETNGGGDGGQGGQGGGNGGTGTIIEDKAKSYFEANAASLSALNFAANQVVSLDDLMIPLQPQRMGDDVEILAILQQSGYGEHLNTGSQVNTTVMHLLGGLGVRYLQPHGVFMAAGLIEHGAGNFDAYTATTFGYGNLSYTGGGVYAKQKWDDGVFIDGAFRMGKVSNNFTSLDMIDGSYDDATRNYYGGHLGAGLTIPMNDFDNMVFYGRALLNRIDDFKIQSKAGENLNFDNANSLRSIFGARYEYNVNLYSQLYAGVGWEHEWLGKTGGTLDGVSIAAPDIGGSSAVFEFGGKFMAFPEMPGLSANAAIKGTAGRHDQIAGQFGLGYRW